jgi:hypothetical protein
MEADAPNLLGISLPRKAKTYRINCSANTQGIVLRKFKGKKVEKMSTDATGSQAKS